MVHLASDNTFTCEKCENKAQKHFEEDHGLRDITPCNWCKEVQNKSNMYNLLEGVGTKWYCTIECFNIFKKNPD